MRKFYAFIISLLPLLAIAQPTITQTGLPVAGLVFLMGTDTTYNAAIPPGGVNQSWDYSTLQNLVNDTTGFESAAGTPYTSSFPTANLVSHNVYTDAWYYSTTNSTGFYLNGVAGPGSPTGGIIAYTPPKLFAPVPFTYTNSTTNVSRIVIDTIFLGFNSQVVRNTHETFLADGWGSLNLPSGNYSNVLRVKITEVVRDSAYYDPLSDGNYIPAPLVIFTPTVHQTTNYRWVQDQQPAYLLGINADSLGINGHYSEYLSAFVILSNHELLSDHSGISTFPNPVDQTFYMNNDLNAQAELVITNSLGQEMESRKVSNEKLIHVDASNYPDGLFLYTLTSKSASRSGKFTVRH